MEREIGSVGGSLESLVISSGAAATLKVLLLVTKTMLIEKINPELPHADKNVQLLSGRGIRLGRK